jgi:stress-induced morphogen
MPINPEALETAILQSIPQAAVRVENLRNDGESHWFAHIASPAFRTLSLLDQHRMVYASIRNLWDPDRDALSLKTTVK